MRTFWDSIHINLSNSMSGAVKEKLYSQPELHQLFLQSASDPYSNALPCDAHRYPNRCTAIARGTVPRMKQANVLPTFADTRHGRMLSQDAVTAGVRICTQGLTILVVLAFWPFCCPAARLLLGHALWLPHSWLAEKNAHAMNAMTTTTPSAALPSFEHHQLPQSTSPPKTRVAVFGSFLGGYHVLQELLSGVLADRVHIVGVATDDPAQEFTHPQKRLWKYPHSRDDELLVARFAAEHGLPVFTGRVKTPEFFEMLLEDWQPQLCLMATFGQKIPTALINYPSLGFYNFHHSGDTWPSYPGPDPIAAIVRDGRKELVLTIHKVTDVIDGGEFVARSHPVAIPDGINAIGMHRITWPQMGLFICGEVGRMLETANTATFSGPLVLQEESAGYCASADWASGARMAA